MRLLEAHNITKTFPGVKALEDVDIEIEEGKIHGIIGENGAGKSTLVKILTGVYQADQGKVQITGENADNNIKLFEKISYVPQELDLFNQMTVAENLFMPFEKTGFTGMVVDKKRLYKEAIPWLNKFKIDVLPDDYVKNISVSNQQLLQVARAVANEYFEVLILDEPTTSLTQKDTECLFKIVKQLRDEKKAIIFISHKLDEIFQICDDITVLRNGKKVGYSLAENVNQDWIVKKMSGRNIDQDYVYRPERKSNEVVLKVENLSGLGFSKIGFELYKGEILGFSGLVGAGRSEIMQTIFGFLPAFSGNITVEGKKWKFSNTNFSVNNGLFYLPEERKNQGILPVLSVKDNIGISLIDQIKKGIIISSKKEKKIVSQVVKSYNIKTPSITKQIKFLSGGNQQKTIIGRVMACNPKVLIFDEPTKGIDVGTKTDIYKIMKELAERGISIILVSSELEELMKCSNRIITIYEGEMMGEFETKTTDKSTIINSIIGDRVN